jgi:hypothetical protein
MNVQERAIEARNSVLLVRRALLEHEQQGPQIGTEENDALRCELSRALDLLRPVAHPDEDPLPHRSW